MYKPHPLVLEPDGDVIIWRYMQFKQFKELLDKSCLFFCRVDNFDDLDEGRSSDELYSFFEPVKKFTYANCWTQNNCESSVMWGYYGKGSEGIAIKSSITRLRNCLDDSKNEQYIGKIDYYSSNLKPETNTLIPFLRKKEQFKDENEIRAITQIMNTNFDLRSINRQINLRGGIDVHVNLTELIESIYTSPSSSPDFIIKIEEIISKYNLKKNVNKSEIQYRPNSSPNSKLKKIMPKCDWKKQMKKLMLKYQSNNSINKNNTADNIKRKMVENSSDECDCSGNFIGNTSEIEFCYRGQKKL